MKIGALRSQKDSFMGSPAGLFSCSLWQYSCLRCGFLTLSARKLLPKEMRGQYPRPVIRSVFHKESTIQAAIMEHKRLIVGENPARIEYLWQAMYRWPRWRGSGVILNTAVSAIEIALWDILGKITDLPIYQLLGGAARDRIRLYNWIGGRTPEQPCAKNHRPFRACRGVYQSGKDGTRACLSAAGRRKRGPVQ